MITKPPFQSSYRRRMPWTARTVGHWFIGDTGHIATNVIGHWRNLTAVNNPPIVVDAVGKAAQFTLASTQYFIESGFNTRLKNIAEMSLFVLFRPRTDFTTLQSLAIVADSSGNSCGGLMFGATDNKIDWTQGSGSSHLASTRSFTTEEWIPVLTTRKGKIGAWSLRMFIDGALDAFGTTINDPSSTGNQRFAIGRYGDFAGNYLTGVVAEARMWDYPLADEMAKSYMLDRYAEFRPRRVGYAQAGAAAGVMLKHPGMAGRMAEMSGGLVA